MSNQPTETETTAMLHEMRDQVFTAQTLPEIASYDEPFDQQIETQARQVAEHWSASQEVVRAQSAAAKIADNVPAWAAQIKGHQANGRLSPAGRAEEVGRAMAEMAKSIDASLDPALADAAAIRASARPPQFSVEKPARTREAEAVFWAKYPHVPRSVVVKEGVDLFRVANDTKASPEAKIHANHLLESAYLPALQRTAESPERFAKNFQPLATQFVPRIEKHLDIVKNRAGYEAQIAFADGLETQAKWLKSTILAGQADAYTLALGAPLLFPKR